MTSKSKKNIHIIAILGSVRPHNYTSKVLALVIDEIKKHADISFELIDPKDYSLPLPGEENSVATETITNIVSEATGVILATPEYHGSYSSVMKLVIENLGYPSVLAGKPVALLGVAAGQIGAIKAIEHLSSVCAHIGAVVLPGPVSIAGVHRLFDEKGRCKDKEIEQRVRNLANTLINYIRRHICPRIALEEMVRQ